MKISEYIEFLELEGASTTLEEVKDTVNKHYSLDDDSVVDVTLGTVVANRWEGDPVWLLIVGPSGGFKTEMIRSLEYAEDEVYPLSTLTKNSLISGYHSKDGGNPSILPELDGKVLAIKDFTTVLTMPSGSRKAVIGQLRDAYDGSLAKSFGNVGRVKVNCHFGLIAGVTPVIDKYSQIEQELGERYLKFRIKPEKPMEGVRKAFENINKERGMRHDFRLAVAQCIDSCDVCNVTIPDEFAERLVALSHFVATVRTKVPRHWKSNILEYKPEAEVGTRLVKQLGKLAMGVAAIRGKSEVTDDEYQLVRRVGEDSVPALHFEVLQALGGLDEGFHSSEEIGQYASLPTATVRGLLEDFETLRILERTTLSNLRGQPHGWSMSSDFRELINVYRGDY